MRIHDVRELSDQQLQQELENSLKGLMNLRFRHATKQLTNTSELGVARKNIARLKTVIRERELQGMRS